MHSGHGDQNGSGWCIVCSESSAKASCRASSEEEWDGCKASPREEEDMRDSTVQTLKICGNI